MSVAALRARVGRLLPSPPGGPLPLAIPRRRIYIVPSRFGMVYGTALFFLLLGSLNYNNNAAILLALLLGMVAMASAFAAVRFLAGLRIVDARFDEAFAGDAQMCRLRVAANDGAVTGGLSLRHDRQVVEARIDERSDALFEWRWPSDRRGRRAMGRIRLGTTYPLGLFSAWTVLAPDCSAIVYPAPETPLPPFPVAREQAVGRTRSILGDSDWHALREFQRGDSPREIAWKVSARHDRWLVNETRSTRQAAVLHFSLDQVAQLDREQGMSRLAAWILAVDLQLQPYTLQLGDRTLGPGIGADHRQRVLTALAELP